MTPDIGFDWGFSHTSEFETALRNGGFSMDDMDGDEIPVDSDGEILSPEDIENLRYQRSEYRQNVER